MEHAPHQRTHAKTQPFLADDVAVVSNHELSAMTTQQVRKKRKRIGVMNVNDVCGSPADLVHQAGTNRRTGKGGKCAGTHNSHAALIYFIDRAESGIIRDNYGDVEVLLERRTKLLKVSFHTSLVRGIK